MMKRLVIAFAFSALCAAPAVACPYHDGTAPKTADQKPADPPKQDTTKKDAQKPAGTDTAKTPAKDTPAPPKKSS